MSRLRLKSALRQYLSYFRQVAETATNWYDGAIVAYQPLGAASYADSLVNRPNPGTDDATEGVAPGWTSEFGWDFNGVDDYLISGLVPETDGTWSMLVRFSDVPVPRASYMAVASVVDSNRFYIVLARNNDVASNGVFVGNGALNNFVSYGSDIANGVYGFAGKTAFENGSVAGTIPAGSASNSTQLHIGINSDASDYIFEGKIQAIGVWDHTLTPTEVATISAAMAAL